jgi:predicted RNA polymerase sigma factor
LLRRERAATVDSGEEFLIPVRGTPAEPSLEGYHLLPSVRGDFLFKLGRFDEARPEFERAASGG